MLNQKAIEGLITTLRTMFPNNPQLKKAEEVLTALPQAYSEAEKMQTGNLQNDINNILSQKNMDKNTVINSIETLKQNPFVNIASRMLGINVNELSNVYKNQPSNQTNNRLDRFR